MDIPISLNKSDKSFYFQWHFIEQCNLRCKHCYQKDYTFSSCNENKVMYVAQLIEKAAMRFGVKARISLTGGEPLLYPNLLFKLMDFFEDSEHFSCISVLTNGTLITNSIAQKFTQYTKLREIQVSLDGATFCTHDMTRGTGSYSKALRGVRILKEYNIFTSIMYTITSLNASEAVEVLSLAKKIGVDAIAVERVTPTGPRCSDNMMVEPDKLREIYEQISEIKHKDVLHPLKIRTCRPLWALVDERNSGGYCPVGFSCLAILHDGTLLPCRRLEIPIGNIFTDGIFKPWYTSPIMWELRNKTKLNTKCLSCTLLNACGGCRAAAFACGNGLMGEDPYCWK